MSDSQSTLSETTASNSSNSLNFADRLREVLAAIRIEPDLSIVYQDYRPIAIAEQYRAYLQQIDSQERDRYLTAKLQNYLYTILNGEQQSPVEESDRESIVNQEDEWYASEFYHQLIECNHGRGYKDSGWLVLQQKPEFWQVSKNGLTVYINPEQELFDSNSARVGATVSVKMPPNLVDRGRYLAVGDAGSVNHPNFDRTTLLQLYFGVASQGATILLSRLTQELNRLQIPFDFKLAYYETDFKRNDAAILEFASSDWQKLKPILQNIYLENQAYFTTTVPFFCLLLANGLGLAEKPSTIFENRLENLGRQYCRSIAEAIVETEKQTTSKCQDSYNLTLSYLDRAKVNLSKIYLNPMSNTVYKLEL